MLDEMACLTRDLLVLKTAGDAGIAMLSGVASDQETLELTKAFTSAELVRMMERIQETLSGFTRSASRRMDAELCLVELCQPELSLEAKSRNARRTRLEEQVKSGSFVPTPTKKQEQRAEGTDDESDFPPVPDDADAPPEADDPPAPLQDEAPVGFWSDLVAAVRKELKPPVSGFFVVTPNAPVQGALVGGKLELRCTNSFTAQMLDKPEILEVVSRKAAAMLSRPIQTVTVDLSEKPAANPRLEQRMNFGRAHSDIVKIKE